MTTIKTLYARIPDKAKYAVYGAASTYIAANYGPVAKNVFDCIVKNSGLN